MAAQKKDTIASATDVLPLNAYAGTYRHNVYGLMTITKEQNKLVARFEHHKGRHANLELLGLADSLPLSTTLCMELRNGILPP